MERSIKHPLFCALALCVATAGCGRGKILDGESRAEASACGGATCDSPIDDALDRVFRNRLLPVSRANDTELCRRLYVDTLGRLPTPEDYTAHCQGKDVTSMLEEMFAQPEYVVSRQKLWADRFGYNDTRSWYRNLLEMDELVGKLYRGEITFSAFVDSAAIHPAVLTTGDSTEAAIVERAVNPSIDARTLARVDADGLLSTVFEKLVLRAPSAEELVELPNLYRLYEIDPAGPDATLPGFTPRRLRIQPCNCVGANRLSCQVTVPPIDMSLSLRFPQVDNCVAETGNSFYFEDIRAEELSSISVVGSVLRGRPDFYSNHVKDTLRRILGYDIYAWLPADTADVVVGRLADAFKQDGSVRNLEANIFRSVLYRQSQTPEAPAKDVDGKDSPIFAGPRKLLPSESYVDSIVAMTGHRFGVCDYRVQTRKYAKTVGGIAITAYAPPSPVHQYPVKPEDTASSKPDTTGRDFARLIGACTDRVTQQPATDASAYYQIGLDILAREACADAASKALPAGYTNGTTDPELEQVVDHQFGRFFLEPPTASSRAAATSGIKSCLQSPDQCTADTAARNLCVALLKSARFATY